MVEAGGSHEDDRGLKDAGMSSALEKLVDGALGNIKKIFGR
jgi:hypothetical protein